MDLSQAFEILEIDETASFSEVKRAYRDLATVWHPDRHSQNSRLLEKSLQKMKELNAAYDLLTVFYAEHDRVRSQSYQNEDKEFTVVTCKKCGTQNRVQSLTGVTFKCGKCRADLFSEKTYKDDEERILCADGSCIGIIRDGRCTECGRTLEEGRREDERKTRIYQEILRNKEELAKRKRKKNNIIRYIFITAFVVLFAYGIYNENSSTIPNQKKSVPQDIQPQKISLQYSNQDDRFQFNETNFNSADYKTDDFKELQRNLKIIGYEIGPIDGVIGHNTISACNKFSEDFLIFSKLNSTKALLENTKVHAAVAKVYPDWLEIVRGNLLEKWIIQQPADLKKEINWALHSNDPKKIIVVLNFYHFYKESPPQLPLPRNGIYWKSFVGGVAPLKISTRDRKRNHFIKIIDYRTNKEILKAFIHGGRTLEFDLPLGSYTIKYAVGEKWYGEHFLFGPYTAFGKPDEVFEFKKIGNQVRGYSLELYLQPYGNLTTTKLSAFQF